MRGERLAWALAALALLFAPLCSGNAALALLTQAAIAALACLSYNLLFGQGGMLSFGHAVYTGLGCYAGVHALRAAAAGSLALPVSLVPLAAGLVGLLAAVPLGWASTRKSGTPFAMITLGLGELVAAAALMFPSVFGGEAGLSANRVIGPPVLGISFGPQIEVYYLCAAYALGGAALLRAFSATPLGRMLNAVRDNAERAAFVGYDPHAVRFLAFLLAGFLAGVAGGLAALHFEIASAETLGAHRSASWLLFAFLGGSAYFLGPVLGALLLVFTTVQLSEWTPAWQLYLGLLFLFMVMRAPQGLAGLLVQGWGRLRSGRPSQWLPAALARAAALLAWLGAGALVELTYRLQLQAVSGGAFRYLGLALDCARVVDWLAAAALLLGGWGASRLIASRSGDRAGQGAGARAGRRQAGWRPR
jgi:branched-chain amino acid transport system permease protein